MQIGLICAVASPGLMRSPGTWPFAAAVLWQLGALRRGLDWIGTGSQDRQAAGGVRLILVGEEQAVPGVGEEALVALRGPAALAHEELVHLGGVGGPDDVGGLAGVQAQRVDGSEVGDEAAHVRGAAFGDLVPQPG